MGWDAAGARDAPERVHDQLQYRHPNMETQRHRRLRNNQQPTMRVTQNRPVDVNILLTKHSPIYALQLMMTSRRFRWLQAVWLLPAFAGVVACASGDEQSGSAQTEEQVMASARALPTDVWVTASSSTSPDGNRHVLVHVENTDVGGWVFDVRLHVAVEGSVEVVSPLPDNCSDEDRIECLLGALDSPTPDEDEFPWFRELEFIFTPNAAAGSLPTTVTISADVAVYHGLMGHQERDVDETPDDNTVTVEL